jgi:hypothetical protein
MAAFSPVFSCFFAKNTPRGRARERATKNPARHAARSWCSFGESALLEDSRYRSQAEN